ncbi:MAG: hypothetical protein ACE5IZ_05425 [Dehalococcoidia bacterium]
MLQVTAQAGEMLLENLRGVPTAPGQALRLKQKDDQFTLELDSPTEDDRVVEHNEQPVIMMDPEVDRLLEDAVIDVQEGPQGASLTIRRRE